MGKANTRPVEWFEVSREFGRIEMECTCPWCDTDVTGYLWSVSGSGKRCPTCRALLCNGRAFEPDEQEKRRCDRRADRDEWAPAFRWRDQVQETADEACTTGLRSDSGPRGEDPGR